MARPSNSREVNLRERACRVVPGGMWGHQNAANLPEGYPQFFARGEGCRVAAAEHGMRAVAALGGSTPAG